MNRALSVVMSSLLLAVAVYRPAAHAGAYTDGLSKCLVRSSTPDDRLLLDTWLFAELSLHPAVQPLTTITQDQRYTEDRKVEALLSRLLTDNCHKEAIEAFRYEGATALEASFDVLGQVAMQDLMTEPHVADGMRRLGGYFNGDEKLRALLAESGIGK